jgi:integrase
MLQKRFKERRSDVYVFPGPDPEKPLDRISRRTFEKIPVSFTPHDLRRTALTLLEALDISAYALRRIANHADGDVTSGYLGDDTERLRKPLLQLERKIFGA